MLYMESVADQTDHFVGVFFQESVYCYRIVMTVRLLRIYNGVIQINPG